jgi:hypothetical protein
VSRPLLRRSIETTRAEQSSPPGRATVTVVLSYGVGRPSDRYKGLKPGRPPVGKGWGVAAASALPLFALIHRSAWKVNSQKSKSRNPQAYALTVGKRRFLRR